MPAQVLADSDFEGCFANSIDVDIIAAYNHTDTYMAAMCAYRLGRKSEFSSATERAEKCCSTMHRPSMMEFKDQGACTMFV